MRGPREFLHRLDALRRDRSGVTGLAFAAMAMPILLGIGLAVGYAQIVEAKAALQHAADAAAIAGASAFTDATQSSTAQTVATNYFNAAVLPSVLAVAAGNPNVTSNGSGTINPALGTQAAFTVTVSATASINSNLIKLFTPSLNMSVSATAANPKVTPSITFSNVRSSACDGNTLYLYQVPMSNGKPTYNKVPKFTTGSGGNYYAIGNNFGGSLPSGQSLPTITANQPLGIMLANTKNGDKCGGTAADSYGVPNGDTAYFYSSYEASGQPPGQTVNSSSYTLITTTTRSGGWGSGTLTSTYQANWGSGNVTESDPGNPSCDAGTTTHPGPRTKVLTQTCTPTTPNTSSSYAATPSGGVIGATPNCSLYIQTGVTQSYVNGLTSSSTPPNAAPSGQQGPCYGPNDTTAGSQYAAATCAQLSALSAHTAVLWWNDTGGNRASGSPNYGWSSNTDPGSGDDRDYNDAFFAFTCLAGNGGSGTGLTAVVLTQ